MTVNFYRLFNKRKKSRVLINALREENYWDGSWLLGGVIMKRTQQRFVYNSNF